MGFHYMLNPPRTCCPNIEAMTGLTIWYVCLITRKILLALLEHFRSEIIIFGIREPTLNILSIRRRKRLSPS